MQIRDEMLHVLSGDGRHQHRYFVERCGGSAACVRVPRRDGVVPGGFAGVQRWYEATGGFGSSRTFSGDTLVAFAFQVMP